MSSIVNPFVGKWTYRSLLNEPKIGTDFNDLEFGRATLVLEELSFEQVQGTIGGTGWSLSLYGSFSYGSPMGIRFQGKGTVGGEPWVYDYIGWLVPTWPNSDAAQQRSAIVGSVIRTVKHGSSPAGVVASFYAVRES